jgi:lipopolysaccharide export system permease protein
MRLLDRYLASAILTSTLLVLGVLLALFTFIQFVDALGDVGKANYQLGDAIRFVLLSLPRQTHEVFPMAALLGTTLGLSALAVDSELTAMRAAGVSVLQIVAAAIKVGLLLALAAILMSEFLVPVTESMAERGRSEALNIRVKQQNDFGMWLRDGQAYVHVSEVLPDFSLLNIDIYRFDENNRMQQHTHALRGEHAQGQWKLIGVNESTLAENRVHSQRVTEMSWDSRLSPDLFTVFTVRPESLSVVQLYRYIRHLEQNKQNTGPYALAFWQKLAAPFSTVVMMVLAIPFVFGQLRSGGLGARLFTGIVIGLAFFVISRGFGYFGLLFNIPAIIGALLPTTMFFIAALVFLRRLR